MVNTPVRTVVTFQATGFNTTDSRDYFINPNCFGDDVARYLMAALGKWGIKTGEEPGQEDFGWYFTYDIDGAEYAFVLGLCEDEGEQWIGWVERHVGFARSLLGFRNRGIDRAACLAIYGLLAASDRFSGVRWYFRKDFGRGDEDSGTDAP